LSNHNRRSIGSGCTKIAENLTGRNNTVSVGSS